MQELMLYNKCSDSYIVLRNFAAGFKAAIIKTPNQNKVLGRKT